MVAISIATALRGKPESVDLGNVVIAIEGM
jgi:hypothetical protein